MKKILTILLSTVFGVSQSFASTDGEKPSTSIKAIIFDCDGTLVDSEDAHYKGWEYALQNHGIPLPEDIYILNFVGKGNKDLLLEANKMIGKDCSEVLLKDKMEYFQKCSEKGIPPIEKTVSFLKLLIKEKKARALSLLLLLPT